jgi:hypothetical protein
VELSGKKDLAERKRRRKLKEDGTEEEEEQEEGGDVIAADKLDDLHLKEEVRSCFPFLIKPSSIR